MRISNPPSLRTLAALLAGIGVASALWLGPDAARTDDRELLQFGSAQPYLFVLLDSSSSMAKKFGGDTEELALGYGDDPNSRLYAAKEGLVNVFSDPDFSDIRFGFAAFPNQDRGRVVSKHWLYYADAEPVNSGGTPWPLNWPLQAPNGLFDGGTRTPQADDAGIVIGPHFFDFRNPSGNQIALADEAGSCLTTGDAAALDLSDRLDFRRVNSFPKLGREEGSTALRTVIWVQTGGGIVYKMTFEPADPTTFTTANYGDASIPVTITLERVLTCDGSANATLDTPVSYALALKQDPALSEFLMGDLRVDLDGNGSGDEPTLDDDLETLWNWSDARDAQWDLTNDPDNPPSDAWTCGKDRPFTGNGWESNYDAADSPDHPEFVGLDYFPESGSNNDHVKPVVETSFSSFVHPDENTSPLDTGDVLPFDWQPPDGNREKFFRRLAPNFTTASPGSARFGIAEYYQDGQNSDGIVELRGTTAHPPLIAMGGTPISSGLLDVRCWYEGRDGHQKCSDGAFQHGWWEFAACNDPDFGCWKPFFVIITDGEDNCGNVNNPRSVVANMLGKTGVKVWALNLGEGDDPTTNNVEGNCGENPLKVLTQDEGECIDVGNKQELNDILEEIAIEVQESSRAFASAAVPSVQATADQALYLSNFTPVQGASMWDGHLNAFLKPLPIDEDGFPDKTDDNFLWDAGFELLNQANRRVHYNKSSGFGTGIPEETRELAAVATSPPDDTSKDLADAFGINTGNDQDDAVEANATVNRIRTPRCAEIGENGDGNDPARSCTFTDASGNSVTGTEYLLGDIFHSNPVIVGTPVNTSYFAANLEFEDGAECFADGSRNVAGDTGDPGYRCFFFRHRNRRKVIFVGSNDGMLHAFNAGVFDENTGRYDNGTGEELFAFMPRPIMGKVKAISDNLGHRFTVDGTITIADAFVDPVNGGGGTPTSTTSDPPDPDLRQWRTLGVGGFREGGVGYYALDLTQPDPIDGSDQDFVPDVTTSLEPGCISNTFGSGDASENPPAGCGPVPYGANLWSFEDTSTDSFVAPGDISDLEDDGFPVTFLDEDKDVNGDKVGNGEADLAATWSRPNIGRIRICDSAVSYAECDDDTNWVDRYVAVFGGGINPDDKGFDPRNSGHVTSPNSNDVEGHFIYMVDLETGKLLYKRELCNPHVLESDGVCVPAGAAPAEPAAVDTDQNGYLDRIYAGTLGGFMFRIDLETIDKGASPPKLPQLGVEMVRDVNDRVFSVDRIKEIDADGDDVWMPQAIFDANWNCEGGTCTATAIPRPIYQRPAVLFVVKKGRFALAFGTGDRENLWIQSGQEGRFYVILDESDHPDLPAGTLPFREDDFVRIVASDTTSSFDEDLLSTATRDIGERGWYLVLEPKERVITDAFNLSGITVFSSYLPAVEVTDDDGTVEESSGGGNSFTTDLCELDTVFDPADTDNKCSKRGQSRNFIVNTTNGNPFVTDDTDPDNPTKVRFEEQDAFVTNPFVEPPSTQADPDDSDSVCNAATMASLVDELKKNFPVTCRFANYTQDVQTIRDDTKVTCIAPIPVCLEEKNWKEF